MWRLGNARRLAALLLPILPLRRGGAAAADADARRIAWQQALRPHAAGPAVIVEAHLHMCMHTASAHRLGPIGRYAGGGGHCGSSDPTI